ncbi:hypothetical protein CCACVL1_05385 [Corchorus capsularis]|uniref:Uncharacterized protein n=1 Tax=Corchorus capsularis TaxID=210143 RepID=A0A1R3JL32_COCAP|nr:hypothetical protein CCACVL1_05385 [Corchorus capsularis]
MKMFKAVKKLKFWSRKKRKRKSLEPPPSYPVSSPYYQYHHCYYSYSSLQPSAPPLPPWLQEELTQDAVPPPDQADEPLSEQEVSYPSLVQFPTEDNSDVVSETESQSYQQYMVPNPVYGVPVVVQQQKQEAISRRERSTGFFGCVIEFGVSLFRCFCPCFRIRDEVCRQM